MKQRIAIVLILALTLTACSAASGSVDLMADVPERVICLAEQPEGGEAAADFALGLFRACLEEGENTLVSPLSVLSALTMTANGAEGETRTQMETVFGTTLEQLNPYLYNCLDSQSGELKLANSLWFLDSPGLTVEKDFLETNANYYRAEIYKTPMDGGTLKDINGWVSEKTDGRIPEILETLSPDTVMVLLNALAFEAEWEQVYEEHQVREGTFTTEDGQTRTVEMMSSEEFAYLEDENATGFLKYYNGRRYAFAALLPNEGVSVSEYVSSLTGAGLQELLGNPRDIPTYVKLPKFETEYSADLSEILGGMGMTDAFDPGLADFSRMGSAEENIYISQVLHRTFLSVAEQGTQAGAATAVVMASGATRIEEYREVTLDRPFVYLLIDCEENLPFFIGALMEPAA